MSKRKGKKVYSPAVVPPASPRRAGNLLAASANPVEAVHAYAKPRPLPGVVPKPPTDMLAQDRDIDVAYNFYAGQGCGEGLQWLGYPRLAELAQRPEYRRMSEIIAKEMTRKWVKLQAAGDDGKPDRIARIQAIEGEMNRLGVQDAFRRATEIDGFFGRGQIYLDLGNNDPDELQIPLVVDPRKIKQGSLKALRVIEPMWTWPSGYNTTNPLAADFYKPTAWYVMGEKVHASRFLTFVSREMPDMLKPAYAFGGLSLSQMAQPYVDNWIRTRQSVSDLIHSFSTLVLKTDMGATLQDGGAALLERVTAFNRFRDNRGLLVVHQGGEGQQEDFSNVATPLGTLDHLQAQAQEHMSSVSRIPLVLFTGITPSGLNASSEGEFRAFYDFIAGEQQDNYTGPLHTLIQIIQISLFGDIDESITFRFEPLWQMSEKEKAEIRKMNAETGAVLVGSQAISPEDERRRVAAEEDGPYHGLEIVPDEDPDEDPDDLDEEDEQPAKAA